MLELIIGGSGSGKSEIAEDRALELYRSFCARSLRKSPEEKGLIYLATMVNSGEGADSRIRCHRDRRRGKGFFTVEIPFHIGELPELFKEKGAFLPERECTVLLEALSDLLANEMFGPGDKNDDKDQAALFDPDASFRIFKDIERLASCLGNLVIVSDDVFRDGIGYEDGVSRYLKGLASLHRGIAAGADRVVEVTAGYVTVWKDKDGGEAVRDEFEEIPGERSLILIIGGKYQGKHDFAAEHFGDSKIIDLDDLKLSERGVRELIEGSRSGVDSGNPDKNTVIIAEENASGIVPAYAGLLRQREEYNRCLTAISREADQVYRVFCGIGMKIK
ncbi:MAG: bifunctional adenosylcobinamide kinase/adenosylcobinamide-phosphate guanylyltransferase [Lachnospiraceae bacterium]|nr:bifunctional adenosylcobinamide kinase/adenosylcobinamide-phosphate guanylyltransferase [Lachnospiraceae bacterium]